MAEYRDVATDRDIIEIANQIRRITQSDRRMTIPEMLEALETLPRNAGLMFNDVRVSNWIEDTTGSGYAYKADVYLEGINEDSVVLVVYAEEQSESGDYAHVCRVEEDKVILFSDRDDVIVIPVIKEVY